MSKASYPLKMPTSLKVAAQRLAKEDGVSLNQWIAVAIAQKIGVVETAADFLKRSKNTSSPQRRKGNAKGTQRTAFLCGGGFA